MILCQKWTLILQQWPDFLLLQLSGISQTKLRWHHGEAKISAEVSSVRVVLVTCGTHYKQVTGSIQEARWINTFKKKINLFVAIWVTQSKSPPGSYFLKVWTAHTSAWRTTTAHLWSINETETVSSWGKCVCVPHTRAAGWPGMFNCRSMQHSEH